MTSHSDDEPYGWTFDAFELTPDRGLLGEDGADLSLTGKPLEMLFHLVRERDRVVPRRELYQAIWPDVSVSDAAFDSVVRDLRRALGDTAADARYIATKRARGLQFVGLVRVLDGPASASPWEEAAVHFERALEALELLQGSRGRLEARPQSTPRTRGDLLVALARAQWAGGATHEARSAFLDAAEVGRRTQDGEILARAVLGYAGRTDVTPGVNSVAVDLLEESLRVLPREPSAIRAEVLARLGTESYYGPDPDKSQTLTREAVIMAERSDDSDVLAYALTARHFSMQRPECSPADRQPLVERTLELMPDSPPSDVRLLALQQRLIDALEDGDGDVFEDTLQSFSAESKELQQPFFQWLASMFEGTRALLRGNIEEAETKAQETLALGNRIESPNALAAFAGQLFGIRREQGRLAELAELLKDTVQTHEELPIFRAGHAAAMAGSAAPQDVREALTSLLSGGLSDFPKDQNWLATLGTLAPAVALHGDEDQKRELFELLLPYRNRVIVVGQGATIHGAASHHLGLLAASLGQAEAARSQFEAAEEIHRRLAAPLWVRRTLIAQEQAAQGKIPG